MRRFFHSLFFCAAFVIFLLFLCTPDTVQRAAHESLLFCVAVLLPSLFPGFVLSDLLIRLFPIKNSRSKGIFYKIFRLPSACLRCWLIGLLAGFPAAADCTCYMVQSGEISKTEAERCLAFTNNPGIIFIICAVGTGLFGSFSVGIYLWLIQTIAATLVGIGMATPTGQEPLVCSNKNPEVSLRQVFPKSVTSSVTAVLNICGFVVFFRVLTAVLSSAVPLNAFKILLSGLLEMTCGISNFQQFDFFTACSASLMLGWSGFSVHFQILNVIESAGLSSRYYFPGKVLQALISTILTAISYPIFFPEENPWIFGSVILFSALFITIFAIRFRKEYLNGKRNLSTGKTAS